MNFRTFFSNTLILAIFISLVPVQSCPQDPDVKKILVYGGASIAAIGLIKIANDKVGTGLTLMAIGTGMAAVAKPDQTKKLFERLIGTTNTEKTLNCLERNFKAACDWLPKV